MIRKGYFTSVWSESGEITTKATLDTETGYIDADSVDIEVEGSLENEYFTDEDGDEYEVCPECHEYIMTTVMKDGIGKCYDEVSVCSNPDCENR